MQLYIWKVPSSLTIGENIWFAYWLIYLKQCQLPMLNSKCTSIWQAGTSLWEGISIWLLHFWETFYKSRNYSQTMNVLLWSRYFFKILNNVNENKGNPCFRLSSHPCIVIFCRRISRIWEEYLCMMLSTSHETYCAEIFLKANNTPQEILLGICSRLESLRRLHGLTYDSAWGGSFWSTWMPHQSNI